MLEDDERVEVTLDEVCVAEVLLEVVVRMEVDEEEEDLIDEVDEEEVEVVEEVAFSGKVYAL